MPKKSLGQHFLKDKEIIRWIVDKVPPTYDLLVEIGPGRGALTDHLPKKKLVLFEIDRDLIPIWKERGFEVFEGDAVQQVPLVFPELKKRFGPNIIVVSNLPYNAGSQIYIELIQQEVPLMVLMFQKEVADKISAPTGDRNFGRISLISQIHYKTTRSKSVPPKAFNPPPNVFSKVIVQEKNETPWVKADFSKLEAIVKSLFAHPRKKLSNVGVTIPHLKDKRPHEVTNEQWVEILESKLV